MEEEEEEEVTNGRGSHQAFALAPVGGKLVYFLLKGALGRERRREASKPSMNEGHRGRNGGRGGGGE